MKRFFAAAALVAFGSIGVPAANAGGDSWADQIIEASKAAEKQVTRRSYRVASLGPASVGDDDDQPVVRAKRTKRARSINSEDRPQTRKRSESRQASRSDDEDRPRRRRSLSGGSVNWTADAGCLDGTLRRIVHQLASDYGPITVNSTCRSRSRNAAVGGADKSYHLKGEAVDFRVHGNVSAVYASLRGNGDVGGLKHYGGGLFHIDTGPRRSW